MNHEPQTMASVPDSDCSDGGLCRPVPTAEQIGRELRDAERTVIRLGFRVLALEAELRRVRDELQQLRAVL